MPLVEVHISIPVPEPNPLLKSISEALSSALGKPEEYVFVHLVPSAFLLFAGKDEPCAMIQVSSIGAINAKTTNAFASKITELLEKQLKISGDRVSVNFVDFPASHWALNGKTFA